MLKKILNIFRYNFPIHFINLITSLLPDCEPVNRIRGTLLKPFFKKTGKNLQISSNVYFTHINKIEVGDNVFIARNCWMGGNGGINISNNTMIGPGVVIASSNHTYNGNTIRFGGYDKKEINIGEEVWIGANTTILPGASIKDNVIVAAGSVVSRSVQYSNCIVGGVPSKIIKQL